MKILSAPTESNVLTELSYLASAVSANSATITVDNGQGFSANDYIVIGRISEEQTELKKIASISDETITLDSQLSFAHKEDALVQKILFNQRKFYISTTKTGTYNILSGGTKDIEVDRPDGTFCEDSTGISTSWYKVSYYNVTTDVETSLDDAIAVQADESNHYTSVFDIRRQAGFEEAYGISDEIIFDYRSESENEFESRIATIYSTPLSSKPKIGRQIVNLLTAGNLLIKEYGTEADIETSKSGQRMLDRADELIKKIIDGELKLIDDDGNLIGDRDTFGASGSNTYTDSNNDKGEMFNIGDEEFRFKDPDSPRS